MNDWQVLLERAQQGDKQAYSAFLSAIVPFLRMRARRYVPAQHLDDFVQETLLTVHRILHTYQVGLPVEPWLSGILRHKYFESRRQIAANEHQSLSDEDSWQPSVPLDEDEQYQAVSHLLAPLNAAQAQVLYATKVEELSIDETANLMQRSSSWVKVNVFRAIQLLRSELHEK
ncbi:sigma-70 family RNA polymerase sigma factor [Alishewanella sp. 16-MA]|uniref:Sigma-70 family RNA polymerase sigma factor n=1 Tax=Alishewanella maricola TaxID=2795740 RepID=A0ABS8C4E2_9ALTE|nr:sigma-70 family RNA polymerase sigma factor [Alishewanella maricola]MCB5227189.1 sigma-70 family RNA polymerase sigma factor [Alishewanella maricola]